MDCHPNNNFYWYSKLWSGNDYRFEESWKLADSQFSKSSLPYTKHKTTAEEIEECEDEDLQPSHYFSIFTTQKIAYVFN